MGLGHFGGGAAAARWLARQGARVTVTDLADAESLAESLASLEGVPIAEFHLAGHREEDFRGAELVVVNPAVRPDDPLLRIAAESGARLVTEIGLLLENCPASVLGVTGSNGKSTTAAMTAAILGAAGRRTWLGGNLGGSLLEEIPQMAPADWVVLELSSFQLWHLGAAGPRLRVAVATGCSPNHLDWHGTWAHYVAAKQRILAGQGPADAAVLNPLDAEVCNWSALARGRLAAPPGLEEIPPLAVPGRHNRINAACAAAAAMAAGCDAAAVRSGLESFAGLPQRLERIAAIRGRRFYNDSTATTPESAVAALESLDGPVWLLAGGRSKGFDFGPLAEAIAGRARGAAFFGSSRGELAAGVMARNAAFDSAVVETLDEALDWCWRRSQPGDSIVLSPACASTDQFRNFHQRGRRFAELVGALAGDGNTP